MAAPPALSAVDVGRTVQTAERDRNINPGTRRVSSISAQGSLKLFANRHSPSAGLESRATTLPRINHFLPADAPDTIASLIIRF